ncbi:MAG TPA: PRC-barrel domain containing protein [Bacteroidetes bacterium]|nr:PRC-barrel domain containing protein [Bacteroidota bacterium]
MKRSVKDLTGFTIEAMDGPKGKVKDFLFDEESWIIRYLEADWGSWFNKNRVLIPRIFLKDPDWKNRKFPVSLTRENIESCPDPEEHMPVSRKYEAELHKHYRVENYWPMEPAGANMFYPPRPMHIPVKIVNEDDLDTRLRSTEEVTGYHIKTLDGTLGHVEDLIVDDDDWQIVYLIVDTSNWLPWSKKVMLPIEFVGEISYVAQQARIDMKSDAVREAPEADLSQAMSLDAEKALYDFYNNIFRNKK